ncbi:MAG: FapA family protein [Gammaproteobacteria bacterium]|nr:FapA family protein [Gammaproteobacteria bacterium]
MQDGQTPDSNDSEVSPAEANQQDPPRDYTAVALEFDEDEGILNAVLTAHDSNPGITPTSLEAMIKSSEYAELYLPNDAIKDLLSRVVKRERGSFPVAERRDATIRIEVASDEMTALVTTRPAYGGEPLTAELLTGVIREAGVQEQFCDKAALESIVLDKKVNHNKVPFATGQEPKPGIDSRFTYLFETESTEGPAVDEVGNVDLYNLHDFLVIDEKTPLLQRTPATLGVEGSTVKGKVLKAKNGNDTGFAKDTPGAVPDPENSDLLISEIKGHPVALHNGVRVDPTLRMDHVDLGSGNVIFDGSLLINGDVTAGVLVEATGDIVIKGVVENATIIAGNDVLINGGVIGPEPVDEEEEFTTRLKAGGNIEAQFINRAKISTESDVIVKEYISHCEISAHGQIKVGEGGRGWLFGGWNHGDMGISATRLGTDANIKTTVSVGVSPEMLQKRTDLIKQKEVLLLQIKQLSAVLGKTQSAGGQFDPEKLENTIEAINQKIADAIVVLGEHEETMEATKDATIEVKDTVFPNVTIAIGHAQMFIQREHGGGMFSRKGIEIEWN